MEEVINLIISLREKYPLQVKTYPGVGEESIELREQTLKFDLGDELKQLYKFSDGMSFLDYGLRSILNKKIGRLEPQFLLEETRLEFISTMGGKTFLLDPGSGIKRNIWFKDDNEGTEIIVAHSVREFFLKFLGKILY